MNGPVLAIDPGEVRIGLAISDPSALVARPLAVLRHRSRKKDALEILRIAQAHQARAILVGVAYDAEGEEGPQARRAMRLVEVLRQTGELPVETWDESGSTQIARRQASGAQQLDALAACVILQEYLDAQAR